MVRCWPSRSSCCWWTVSKAFSVVSGQLYDSREQFTKSRIVIVSTMIIPSQRLNGLVNGGTGPDGSHSRRTIEISSTIILAGKHNFTAPTTHREVCGHIYPVPNSTKCATRAQSQHRQAPTDFSGLITTQYSVLYFSSKIPLVCPSRR